VSKNHRSTVLLECENPQCGAKYQSIKPGLRRCDACGGVLRPVEKKHLPRETPK
jgi:hypothetical protein